MAQKPTFDYDIIVIGSGAAGAPAASILARAGKKVAVVERGTFGGESPNWGDMPLGAMLYAAEVFYNAKRAAKFGLRTNALNYNHPSLLSWRDTVIKRTGAGGNRYYYEKQGISVFSGNAHFLSPNEITVNRRHLSARKFLIATGAAWEKSTIPGSDKIPYLTPENILSLTRPPKTLFIVGGNATAMEIAYLYASFGTKVYVAEKANRILPEFDVEVGPIVAEDAKVSRNMTILTRSRVVALQKEGLQKRVTYIQGRQQKSVRVDEILVAEQRVPQTDMGLENAGVAYTHQGITVNTRMQTSARHIFAAGNITNPAIQTHAVLTQSRTAAHNLTHRTAIEADLTPNLLVAFTFPEVAQVGLNEQECIKRDLRYKTAVAPLTLTARSNITDCRNGFVKLIIDTKGVLIGAAIVAPHASDLISELSIAVRHRLTAKQLISTPSCFTSWSEATRIAAGKLL